MRDNSAAGAGPFVALHWTAERQDELSGDIYWAIHAASDYQFIANVYSNAEHARLIAAAPDLLAALERIVEGKDDQGICDAPMSWDLRQMGRAAIAKAEGR